MFFASVTLVACSRPVQVKPQGVEGTAQISAVPEVFQNNLVVMVQKKGETLYSISKTYTGNGKNWKKIAKANNEMNPQKLHVGQKVVIPQSLVSSKFAARIDKPEKKAKKLEVAAATPVTEASSVSEEPIVVAAPPVVAAPVAAVPPVAPAPKIRVASLETEAESSNPPIRTQRAQLQPVLAESEERPVVKVAPKPQLPPKEAKVVAVEKVKPVSKKNASGAKSPMAKSARYRVISSSGYGSLNREVSRLDAELAKAEALAEKARTQPSQLVVKPVAAPVSQEKKVFSCSKNKCSGQ